MRMKRVLSLLSGTLMSATSRTSAVIMSLCLRNPLRLEHLLDGVPSHSAHVIHFRVRASGHDALHVVVLEVDPRIVVARVARFHLSGPDQLVIERPASRLTVVVGTVASLDEAEALNDR